MTIKQGEALKVWDEGVLVVEYFPLAYVDLNHRFFWRTLAPIETVWQEGNIPIMNLIGDRDPDGSLSTKVREMALAWWKEQPPAPLLKPIERVDAFLVDLVRSSSGG